MFSWIRSVFWMLPLVILSIMIGATMSVVVSLFDGTGKVQHRMAIRWARIVLGVCQIRFRVKGEGNLGPGQVYVFCSNHFSLIDTPFMFAAMPRPFRIMARHGLWKIPFLGWHLDRAGHIPVNRENPRAAAGNIKQAAQKIRDGYSLLLFPEGGRTREDHMGPFKPGAAYIAIRARAPLVPMAIVGTRKILPPNSAHLRPGWAELRVGKPLPTEGLSNRDAAGLIARAQKEVAKLAEAEVEQAD